MNEIKNIGTIQMLDSIYDVEFVPGVEGSVAPLLFGDAITCHALNMPPGYYAPHPHPFELTILCVRGECELIQGDLRRPMKLMSLICVPKHEESGFEVKREEVCTILVFVAPKQWTREDFYEHICKYSGGKK